MVLQEVRRRYAGKAKAEWERLRATPIARIEYMITSHCLERYLPDRGRILDAGSGPGRYAIDLARRGYQVMMFDLVREMLQLGRAKCARAGVGERVPTPVEGDICALPYAGEAFDAVISLGAPLSHLTEAHARSCAVEEMARVVKPGGPVFLTCIARLAAYRGAIYWPGWQFFDKWLTAQARAAGISRGSQIWYCFATGELEGLARQAGLQIVDRVGCEGLASYLPMRRLAQIEADPRRGPVWREILLETCNDPTIIGVSNHLLIVARKA
jgi:SAM-dependent methyltransferase